jgi:hypothetical protein
MGMLTPIMDSGRARRELGWTPRVTALDTVLELLRGLREGAGMGTAPLAPDTSGVLRWRELATRVGASDRM